MYANEGMLLQNVNGKYAITPSKKSFILVSKKDQRFSVQCPPLQEGTRLLLRYICKDGKPSDSQRIIAVRKDEKDGSLYIPGHPRPKKRQLTIKMQAYAVHEGVIGTKDEAGNLRISDNTSLATSGLIDQNRSGEDLSYAVAESHRKVRNSCIKVTTAELVQVRDTIITTCKEYNQTRGRESKISYRKLAETQRDKDLEYGHITQFCFRTLRGFLHHLPKGAPQPMYDDNTTLVEYLESWIKGIDSTIDYSAINSFDVRAEFECFRPKIAPDLYRTIFDKRVTQFNAVLKQRLTRQMKAKNSGEGVKYLGFHQGWPKTRAKKEKKKKYTYEQECSYFFGRGMSNWSIPHRLTEGGRKVYWRDLEGAQNGAIRLSSPVSPDISGHPDMSSHSRRGKRELRKVSYQYAGGSPLVDLVILVDQPIDPNCQIAQVVLGHRERTGLYVNLTINRTKVELKPSKTDKTVAVVPHFKRVGDQLEVITGVDSDGSRICFNLPLDEDWSELIDRMREAAEENRESGAVTFKTTPKNPKSLRSRFGIVKDEVFFRRNLSWKSVYASGIEENAEAAKADIESIKQGVRNLTLTNHALLHDINNLSWSEKVSALRNAVIEVGSELLTEEQRKDVDWEMLGYGGLHKIKEEMRLRFPEGTPAKGVVPSTQDKSRTTLPFIPELFKVLVLWERLSDRCYELQRQGKQILGERQKNIYSLYNHHLLRTYGAVRFWAPDLEGMQKKAKKKKEEKALDNSSKFRQWASLSTFKSRLLAAADNYESSLEVYAYHTTDKGLKDLAKDGLIKLVKDVNPTQCAKCGQAGTIVDGYVVCPQGHRHEKYENRALLMLK
jgi:hypothetical protein